MWLAEQPVVQVRAYARIVLFCLCTGRVHHPHAPTVRLLRGQHHLTVRAAIDAHTHCVLCSARRWYVTSPRKISISFIFQQTGYCYTTRMNFCVFLIKNFLQSFTSWCYVIFVENPTMCFLLPLQRTLVAADKHSVFFFMRKR